jgi:DNA-binding NtrC family response regulator
MAATWRRAGKRWRFIGENKLRDVDFRLISATNRYLAKEAAEERFRQDLFHRIAVGVIKLPPLRDRGGDLPLLLEHFCGNLNKEFATTPGWEENYLSIKAAKAITEHSWPGNVRELINTLTRAFVFSGGTEVDETAIKDALLVMGNSSDEVLNRPLGNGFSIEQVIADTATHYLERGIKQAGGNKTQAAKLLGLNSYQTLTNWLERYEVGE